MARVPDFFMKKIGIDVNDIFDINDQYGCIMISPTELKAYSLDSLLERISEVNLHQKIDFGLPIGKEQF